MTEDMAMRYEKLITDPDEENKTADAPDEEGTSRRPSHKDAPKAPSFDNIVFRPGFVRLNFPYFLPQDCFSFVIKAILMTAEMGWLLLPLVSKS
ncbi:unnamed protein product [Lymnaea stagnalis]|uniref:Uncharacterized protein n=1 Tax=Lymnaea stagnalis TaxID=6523 RepID=A0AAV2IDP6_LYMST